MSGENGSRGRRVLRIFMICTAPDIIKMVKYTRLRWAKLRGRSEIEWRERKQRTEGSEDFHDLYGAGYY